MNPLQIIRDRFESVLARLVDQPGDYLALIRPAQDAKFGDYQANFAMPLQKVLQRPPRDIAAEIVAAVDLCDLCEQVEIAGPGFINMRLRNEWLVKSLSDAFTDVRIGIKSVAHPRTYVVDFSSPNVAKPMHVGHIRSTVIGDCLSRILRFLGHQVITDNHLGDWGTQFGMIIYGYKNFLDAAAFAENPVAELSRLYRLVRMLVDYHDAKLKSAELAKAHENLGGLIAQLKRAGEPGDKQAAKQYRKALQNAQTKAAELQEAIGESQKNIDNIESNPELRSLASAHPNINQAVLNETARLHEGDPENVGLWKSFLPNCHQDIQRIYDRLEIKFDYELGESFYHDRLAGVVERLKQSGLARESEGAICVFLDGFETPMIVQKKDGAFLYATTDLATVEYRMEQWQPDAILYVVDHRQSEHFEKLFATVQQMGFRNVQLKHVSFGTVLGDDNKPFKTRKGDAAGLEGLLDEAERKAMAVLRELADERESPVSDETQSEIARIVGIGALKFADLSQHRASDYKFSYDKMLELKGFTATYSQYLYARVQGIFRNVGVLDTPWRDQPMPTLLDTDVERELAIQLLRFGECLEDVLFDYRPNLLAQYLFELTQTFFRFYNQCSVKNAESEALKLSRLQLCDLTGRTVRQGLELMGIGVVDQM